MPLKRSLAFAFALTCFAISLALIAAQIGWILLWPAAAALYVGALYLFGWPAGFGKDPATGRIHPLMWLLLAPWFLLQHVVWRLEGRLLKEGPWQEVSPGVLLGRRPAHAAPDQATLVVDMTAELSAARLLPHQRYLCLPTLDSTPPDLDRASALLDQLAAHDGCVYIHCASGHGRSATIVAAHWLRSGLVTSVEEAEAKMRAARPGVRLSADQRALVRALSARSAPASSPTPDPAS